MLCGSFISTTAKFTIYCMVFRCWTHTHELIDTEHEPWTFVRWVYVSVHRFMVNARQGNRFMKIFAQDSWIHQPSNRSLFIQIIVDNILTISMNTRIVANGVWKILFVVYIVKPTTVSYCMNWTPSRVPINILDLTGVSKIVVYSM